MSSANPGLLWAMSRFKAAGTLEPSVSGVVGRVAEAGGDDSTVCRCSVRGDVGGDGSRT